MGELSFRRKETLASAKARAAAQKGVRGRGENLGSAGGRSQPQQKNGRGSCTKRGGRKWRLEFRFSQATRRVGEVTRLLPCFTEAEQGPLAPAENPGGMLPRVLVASWMDGGPSGVPKTKSQKK